MAIKYSPNEIWRSPYIFMELLMDLLALLHINQWISWATLWLVPCYHSDTSNKIFDVWLGTRNSPPLIGELMGSMQLH